jgi:N-acetylglucosaminyl-diphospho-decaprenol L-rhamnosyltransferase
MILAMKPFTISLVSHAHFDLCLGLLRQFDQLSAGHIEEAFVVHNLNESNVFPEFAFRITTIQNASVKGFGANHNQVFARVKTPYVVIVNPDIDLVGDPFPALLVALESDSKVGLTAPTVLNPDMSVANSMRGRYTLLDVIRQKLNPSSRDPASAVWFAGMFLVAKVQALNSVAGFDERYFMYCEDVDLCRRLKLSAWSLVPATDAKVIHVADRASHRSLRSALGHLRSSVRYWLS